jgi:hypothetical protein
MSVLFKDQKALQVKKETRETKVNQVHKVNKVHKVKQENKVHKVFLDLALIPLQTAEQAPI